MLRHRSIKLLLAAAIVSIAGFTIWPGCATVSLSPHREPISSLKRKDFDFEKKARHTRSELYSKVGEPDELLENGQLARYKLNHLTRRRIWLLFGFIPFGTSDYTYQLEVALIHFDKDDRVERIEIKQEDELRPMPPHATGRD